MADENYAIQLRLDGIPSMLSELQKVQASIASIKPPTFKVDVSTDFSKVEAAKLASEAKVNAATITSLGKIEAAQIASNAKITAADTAAIAKLEALELASNAKIEAAKIASASKVANSNKAPTVIAGLERQKAASTVRVSDGSDKEAARVAQEILRYKQQIAAIEAKLINPADIANAKKLADEINRLNLDKIKKGFDDASPVTFSQFIGATTEKARDLAEQLQNTSQTLERIGTTFNQVAQASSQAFLAFDSARVKVRALSKDSQGLALQSKQLVGELGNQATSTQVLAANYQILSSGFNKTADVTAITRASLIGATAGFTDTATVADALTSVLNAYGKSASESNKIIDQFIVTQDRGKTTVAEFAANLGNVIPIAANADVSFEEVQGALATLTLQGVKSDTAITNIKNVISDIVNPSKQAQKAFEGIGIANSAATLKSEGLIGVLRRIQAAGKGGAKELAQFFGDIRSQAGATGLLKGELQSFAEITADVTNRSGKALQDYSGIANSAQGRVTAAFNKINEALVNLGGGVVRAFSPLIAVVVGAVDLFNQLPEPIQTVLGGVIGLVGGVATLGAALTAIGAAAPAFVGGLKLFGFQAVASTAATTGLATATTGLATASTGLTTASTGLTTGLKNIGAAAGTAALSFVAFEITKTLFDNITTAIKGSSEATKGLKADYEEYLRILKEPLPDIKSGTALGTVSGVGAKKFKDEFGDKNNLVESGADAINDTFNKAFNQKEGDFFFGRTFKDVKSEQSSINFADQITASDKYAKLVEQTQLKIQSGQKLSQREIDGTSQAITKNIQRIQAIEAVGDVQKFARNTQLNYLEMLQDKQVKLTAAKKETAKAEAQVQQATEADRDRAKLIKETRNQDAEKNIKRSFDDGKAKRDTEAANQVKGIEEKNAIALSALKQKQALATEDLKAAQQIKQQDLQRAFDDAQSAKKRVDDEKLDSLKRDNEAKLQARSQAFEEGQAKAKQALSDKIQAREEAAATAREARNKKNEEALSGAKQAISNEGAIAKDPQKQAQIADDQRIRDQAAQSGTGGEQSQEQLIARAKQLAQVSAIATEEEQRKVTLALDELDKANKAKQAEIDKAEQAKLAEQARTEQRALDTEQKASKLAFDAEIKAAQLSFEKDVLQPEKLAQEQALQASKLAFERGELAALKAEQVAQENALKLEQETKEREFKKATELELDALKSANKEKEIALDRAFEDQKIERERAFKDEQRSLDKASAIEIQAILGKSARQIIDAIAVTKGGTSLSSAIGVKGIPQFAKGVKNFKGGVALVGEQGAELVNLPRGSNVIPNNQLISNTNNSRQKTNTVNNTYNITTSETPSDAVIKFEREKLRSQMLYSGV